MPTRLANKPTLHFGLALYLNAWFDLDLERERPTRISRSQCFSFAADYDLTEEQRDDLWYFINHMEREFLPWWIKRQPKPKAKPEPRTGRKRGGK